MSLKKYDGLQSEIFVPITPTPVWAPVKKKLRHDCSNCNCCWCTFEIR